MVPDNQGKMGPSAAGQGDSFERRQPDPSRWLVIAPRATWSTFGSWLHWVFLRYVLRPSLSGAFLVSALAIEPIVTVFILMGQHEGDQHSTVTGGLIVWSALQAMIPSALVGGVLAVIWLSMVGPTTGARNSETEYRWLCALDDLALHIEASVDLTSTKASPPDVVTSSVMLLLIVTTFFSYVLAPFFVPASLIPLVFVANLALLHLGLRVRRRRRRRRLGGGAPGVRAHVRPHVCGSSSERSQSTND